jgi:glutamate transport system substrate-binding protein
MRPAVTRRAVLAVALLALVALVALAAPRALEAFRPSSGEPSASPAASSPPRFELASYMYALQTRGRIRVGVLDSDLPFGARDAGGARSGFDADLARELALRIFGPRQNADSVIEWVSVTASTVSAALARDEVDVAFARLAAVPAQTGAEPSPIELSDPYFVTGERVLVSAANDEIKELPDLDTKTVCVQRGTTVGEDVEAANAFAKILPLDSLTSCLDALRQGQADAIGAHEVTLWSLRKQDPATKIVGRYVTTERYGIGLKRNSGSDRQGFRPFVDAFIGDTIRDGTWAQLYARYVTPVSADRKSAPGL